MFHLIRKEYGYEDEYILDKSLSWLRSSVDSIMEDRYNKSLQLSQLVQMHIAQIFGSTDIKIPVWKDIGKGKGEEELKDDDLSDFGLGM